MRPTGRQAAGYPGNRFVIDCRVCGRDFIEDTTSGEYHAVNLSIIDFVRLACEVTDKWFSEPCPKKRTPSDAQDRLKLF
jgi:hypothetical protein